MSEQLTTSFVAETMRARGYRVIDGPDGDVTGGAADSRNVRPGDLFTAFPGENTDGNEYVAQALANGAIAAICEHAPEGEWPGRTIVVAPDATRAVGELAQAWRRECRTPVVGITGTVGKTTAKGLTSAVLSQRFRTHKSEGNFNSREGLPLAIMSLRRDDEVSVLEMGMDSAGEIAYLCGIAQPVVGIVLNIGLTHISKLGSVEAIAREKLALPRFLAETGTAVLNADDPRIAGVADEISARAITFGKTESANLLCGPVTDHGLAGTTFDVSFEGNTARVDSPLAGEHTVPAALAAIGAALAMGMSLEEAASAVSNSNAAGRARVLPGLNDSTIIDDRYNSSPASLTGALGMLAGLPGRRIALLGRMAELGDFEEAEHRAAGRIAATSCDVLAAAGEECRVLIEAAQGFGHADAHWFHAREEAAAYVRDQLRAGDYVLVKASRGAAFETILPMLGAAS